MEQPKLGNYFVYRVGVLTGSFLMLFPVSIVSLPTLHGLIMVCVMLLAFWMYFFNKVNQSALSSEERFVYWSVIVLAAVAFAVTFYGQENDVGVSKVGRMVALLAVIPVHYYFRHIVFSYHALWYGLVLGAVFSAFTGLYDVLFGVYRDNYVGRANGSTHPIIFGDLALLMGLMSVAGWQWFKARGRIYLVFPALALGCGLFSSLLSQSRGGWVALPLIAVIFFKFASLHVNRSRQVVGWIVLVIFMIGISLVPQSGVQKKVQLTVDNIEAYFAPNPTDDSRWTSVGTRLEMWKAAVLIFLDNPVVGVGWGNYQDSAAALAEKGILNRSASAMNHPHNQFLSAMVSGGVVALIAVLAVFIAPFRLFYSVLRARDGPLDSKLVALAGITCVIGFFVFNLTESFLERSRTVVFFGFYIAVLMAGVRSGGKASA